MHSHALELSLGLSFILGILHALEPGHGKSAMFVYMLQQRKSFWHPVVMGVTTGVSHAISLVLIALAVHLGVHVLSGDEHAGHQHAGVALQWISSILLVGIGCRLLWRGWHGKITSKTCGCCNHSEHATPLTSKHSIAPTMNALTIISSADINRGSTEQCNIGQSKADGESIDANPGTSLRMTMLLGIAVGLLPCPTALAAYFAGLSSGNPVQGYIVIAVFSGGIALSLILCGFLFQFVGGFFRRINRNRISVHSFAYIQAVTIIAIGLFYLSRLMLGVQA